MGGVIWIQGAERLTPSQPGGVISAAVAGARPTAPPRAVWHTVEAPAGTMKMVQRMIDVLTEKSAEPHLLYDPETDWLGQFFPLDLAGRALKNDGAAKTNRTGLVCIQIEVMGYAARPFTDTWRPGPKFRALMAAIRSWGIPDMFPMGRPPKYPGGSVRDRSIWLAEAGHYCHANVPGNDHGDPGAISPSKLFAAAGNSNHTEEDPLSGMTPDQIGAAVAKALAPTLDAIEKKYVVADNEHDAQVAAWEAVGTAYASHLLAGGAPLPAAKLDEARDQVWSFLQPLWTKS